MSAFPELSGTVTEWLKPRQPLALWWQSNYPGLREVSRELAARVQAANTTSEPLDHQNAGNDSIPSIPVDTPGLRYYDYGQLGGAIDYRMRMEFTRQWGGDPARSAFTRAWGGKRGSLAHAASALLADCAPALALGATRFDFTPLLTPSGYRSALYASGHAGRSDFWGHRSGAGGPGPGTGTGTGTRAGSTDDMTVARQRDASVQIVRELERAWPLFAYLCHARAHASTLTLEELAAVACRQGRAGGSGRLQLLRCDLAAQLALWHRNPARRGEQPPRVIAANPTFAGSTRLPADGDLIVRSKEGTGSLIDFKSAKRIEPSGMLVVLRQILTYALMDERDDYEIRRIGFYFTRYGVWAHWGLGELLDTGMGLDTGRGQSKTVDSHQQGLLRFLLDLRQPQAIDVVVPRR